MSDPIITQQKSDRAIEYALNPTKDRLPGFTIIPKGSAMPLAIQLAKYRMFDPTRHQYMTLEDGTKKLVRRITVAESALNYYFELQRSVEGKVLFASLDLASLELGGEDNYQDPYIQ